MDWGCVVLDQVVKYSGGLVCDSVYGSKYIYFIWFVFRTWCDCWPHRLQLNLSRSAACTRSLRGSGLLFVTFFALHWKHCVCLEYTIVLKHCAHSPRNNVVWCGPLENEKCQKLRLLRGNNSRRPVQITWLISVCNVMAIVTWWSCLQDACIAVSVKLWSYPRRKQLNDKLHLLAADWTRFWRLKGRFFFGSGFVVD